MTLFNGADHTTPEPQVEDKNYLEELVGEGKKFADVTALARGKAEADAFIARLKEENEGMRNEMKSQARLGDLVDQLANLQKPPEEAPPAHQPNTAPEGSLDPAKLQEMLDNLLSQREQKSLAERNRDTVKQKLIEAYGTSYSAKLLDKAKELGLSQDAMDNLAAQSPAAFLTLVGVGQTAPVTRDPYTPPTNSRSQLPTNGHVDRTKAFYDAMKKANPVQYWDKKTQNQMHQDAIRLGERFFN